MKRERHFWREYTNQVKRSKLTFAVYIILRALVVTAMVISCIRGDYENLFICGLSLILFLIPAFVEKNFGIELPCLLEIIILLFIFAAEILGEMESYYTKVPNWDTMLHTINGFICAAVGFGMIDILNRNEKIKFELSPVFLAIVAFCFSMTIGVLWEFFEFFCDVFFQTDMQKDFIVNSISTTLLSGNTKAPQIINGIKSVAVNGQDLGINGYLDIGLYDTMKDLFVNFIGAVVFSVIGYFYVRSRGKGRFVRHFIPQMTGGNKSGASEDEHIKNSKTERNEKREE